MASGHDFPFEYRIKISTSHGSDEAIDSYIRNIAPLAAWEAGEEQVKNQ